MAISGSVGQPWFGGARSLEEQMLGLEPALVEARGKTVVDFGCAEGLIALEFAKAGALSVYACDYNEAMIEEAKAELVKAGPLPVEFEHRDMVDMIRAGVSRYDIVLALAVLHKLPDPAAGVRYCAESALDLIVVRLPEGSTGRIRGKHHGYMHANVPVILTSCGFKRERKEAGPRGEWVHYYRKC